MNILITGGTGFLGKELINRLKGNQITVLARNEGKLIELKNQFPDIEIIPGDISDERVCSDALQGVEKCYHLAAMKHIGLAEQYPERCIATNITGTMNLLNWFYGDLFVFVSTDKAAQVNGVYGATKFLNESIILKSKFPVRIIRYGNVLYSTGSVLCKWKELIKEGKKVIITDPKASRFFWTVSQAVDEIFKAENQDHNLYIPEMKSILMGDLLGAMINKYAPDKEEAFRLVHQIGLQPGENLHETLDGKVYSNEVDHFTIDEITEMI